MHRLALAAVLLAAPLAAAPLAAAQAQVLDAPALQGRTVHDVKGVVLGVIEKVVLDARGRPAQVLVRVQGHPSAGLRSLAISGLAADGAGFTTPLSKAEFESMPAVLLDDPGA
ncbi:hypothetical protein [Phenylobacterium aquaticum]|uniref:hypothetical protein n=1 Tax=Phenylobacterium aquaticum TaxID=1763816 RepID=UPI0026EAEF45|nr:hypothetical protein [Phenylobacterium aquaticum]